ncbi:MAG: hypothetical protein ABWY36_05985 [Leifsonia sp.]
MSRSDRAIVVFPDARGAVIAAGGTMARIVEDGGRATLVTAAAPVGQGASAIARLMGGDHVVTTPERIADLVADRAATVVIVADTASDLVSAAVNAAETYAIPVYTAVPGPGARRGAQERVIDIDRQQDVKRDVVAVLGGPDPDLPDRGYELFERRGDLQPAQQAGRGSRIMTAVLALVIGIIYGAVGTVAHTATIDIGGVVVPWGIVLALAGVVTLLVGLRLIIRDRLVVAACAIGLVGTVALFTLRSFGGSVLIPQSTVSVIWTIAPALVAALVLAWPSLPPRSVHVHRA